MVCKFLRCLIERTIGVDRKALYHDECVCSLNSWKKAIFGLEFCPTCGSFLTLTKEKEGKEIVGVLACGKCGYRKPSSKNLQTGKTLVKRKHDSFLTVITEEDQKITTMPTIQVSCPKCENNLVFIWQVQTRGGDEASTQFMRCTKCGHTFREYT